MTTKFPIELPAVQLPAGLLDHWSQDPLMRALIAAEHKCRTSYGAYRQEQASNYPERALTNQRLASTLCDVESALDALDRSYRSYAKHHEEDKTISKQLADARNAVDPNTIFRDVADSVPKIPAVMNVDEWRRQTTPSSIFSWRRWTQRSPELTRVDDALEAYHQLNARCDKLADARSEQLKALKNPDNDSAAVRRMISANLVESASLLGQLDRARANVAGSLANYRRQKGYLNIGSHPDSHDGKVHNDSYKDNSYKRNHNFALTSLNNQLTAVQDAVGASIAPHAASLDSRNQWLSAYTQVREQHILEAQQKRARQPVKPRTPVRDSVDYLRHQKNLKSQMQSFAPPSGASQSHVREESGGTKHRR